MNNSGRGSSSDDLEEGQYDSGSDGDRRGGSTDSDMDQSGVKGRNSGSSSRNSSDGGKKGGRE